MAHFKFIILIISLLYNTTIYSQKKESLSINPPMGWNSWSYFGKKDINEKIVYQVIDAFVENGLKDAGYKYIVIDGGWRDSKLGKDGRLIPNPKTFPNGIKPIADYAHLKGLKLGLHIVPGTHDCSNNEVGSLNKEELHLSQFVEWGIDFLKIDRCVNKEDYCKECTKGKTGWDEMSTEYVYRKWSKLLNNCKRDILFSISAYTFRSWNREVCNMSRTTGDILSKRNKQGAIFDNHILNNKGFISVMSCALINNKYASFAGNGYWNDPDMLVLGKQGLSYLEQKTHFALWAIMSAPLMLSNDPRDMTQREKTLITNKDIIAINQDPSEQGSLIYQNSDYQIWGKHLSGGNIAMLLININENKNVKINLNLKDFMYSDYKIEKSIFDKEYSSIDNCIIKKSLSPHESSLIVLSK